MKKFVMGVVVAIVIAVTLYALLPAWNKLVKDVRNGSKQFEQQLIYKYR